MKKLLIAFLLVASMAGAQTLTVPQIITNGVAFKAHVGTTYTHTDGNSIGFNIVDYDSRSGYDGTATYTIPLTASYTIFVVAAPNGNGQRSTFLQVGGVKVASGYTTAAGLNTICIAYTKAFSSGDKITVTQNVTGPTDIYGNSSTGCDSTYIIIRQVF